MKRKIPIIFGSFAGLFILIGIIALATGGSDTSPTITSKPTLSIGGNNQVDKLTPGMICGRDFKIDDDYFLAFVRTVNLSKPDIYYPTNDINSPYFMWVCYPQITRGSPTRIIVLEDNGSGIANSEFTVLRVVQVDTIKAINAYGGTKGTRANGW